MATSELEGKDIWGDDADDIDDEIMSVSLVAQRAAFRNSRWFPLTRVSATAVQMTTDDVRQRSRHIEEEIR